MRILTLDVDEFETSSSEELISFASCPQSNFAKIEDFIERTGGYANTTFEPISDHNAPTLTPHYQLHYWISVKKMLAYYCHVEFVEEPTIWLLEEDWNVHDYAFRAEGRFYRFVWSTSA